MRLIDADELFKKVDVSRFKSNHKTVEGRMVHDSEHNHFMKMIADAPTVDIQAVEHSEWIPIEYDGYADGNPVWDVWECKKCRHEHNGEYDSLTAYCPDCGARMDGESNDC